MDKVKSVSVRRHRYIKEMSRDDVWGPRGFLHLSALWPISLFIIFAFEGADISLLVSILVGGILGIIAQVVVLKEKYLQEISLSYLLFGAFIIAVIAFLK